MAHILSSHPYLASFTGFLLARWIWAYSKDLSANPRRLPKPPGPKQYPVIGNLLEAPLTRPWLTYDEWFKVYGDLIYFEILGKGFLVIGSVDRANDLFERRSAKYSDRPRLVMIMDLMGWDYNMGLIPYGNWWRRHRRAFHQFFNSNQLPTYLPTQMKHVHAFLRRLLHTPNDFLGHTRHLFAALITDIAYGIQIKEKDDPYIQHIEEVVHAVGEAAIPGRYLVDLFPIMKHIPQWFPGAGWKRKAAYYKKINDMVSHEPYDIVKKNLVRIFVPDKGPLSSPSQKNGTAVPSVAASLIEALPVDNPELKAEEETIAINVAGTAFLGGADTTVSTLQSFFLAMCLHPEIVKKAQKHLDCVLEGKRLPVIDDRPSLPYIVAIVKEATRWHPVLPMGVPHMTSEDDEYNGWFIPKGTIILGSAWAMLHDPKAYENPFSFMPERFMKDDKLDPLARDPHVAAFGFGRRICPGRHMSDVSLFLTIASVLACFDIHAPVHEGGKPTQLNGEYTSGNFQFPLPFEAVIKPRSEQAAALIRNSSLGD